VRYEELARDPVAILGNLYEHLRLGEFTAVEAAIKADLRKTGRYTVRNAVPPEGWTRRVRDAWGPIFRRYGYALP
jgi:hypothetical protein